MIGVQRQPFGELTGARLRALNSTKNCQNAVTQMIVDSVKAKHYSNSKSSDNFCMPKDTYYKPPVVTSVGNKRSHDESKLSNFDSDSDGDIENQDPSAVHAKRSKANDGNNSKQALSHIYLTTVPAAVDKKPAKEEFRMPGGASTAPAGRSPKGKRMGLLSSSQALYKRHNPPGFDARNNNDFSASFSIGAALAGTAATNRARITRPIAVAKSKLSKGCGFDIHVDTPEQHTANITTDNEKRVNDGMMGVNLSRNVDESMYPAEDGGHQDKENHAPADKAGKPVKLRRRRGRKNSKGSNDMTLDEEPRVALRELRAEELVAEGLDASSVVRLSDDDDLPTSNVPTITANAATVTSELIAHVAVAATGVDFVIAEDR